MKYAIWTNDQAETMTEYKFRGVGTQIDAAVTSVKMRTWVKKVPEWSRRGPQCDWNVFE